MFQFPDALNLAQTPTPLYKLERLTSAFEGPELFIKRDDLTGVALSGNKIRKLDFLLCEAKNTGCDVVITCGGNQSNHARTTAVAAARIGLKCHLILKNNMTLPFDGNLFLDKLVGAKTQYISPKEYDLVDDIMQAAAGDYAKEGLKACVIPEGGSNALGALGYVKAAQELALQIKQLDLHIDAIVVAVGSGGTYAGLLLGKHLFRLGAEIYGINVCDDKHFFTEKIFRICREMTKRFQMDVRVDRNDIHIIDGYVGKGYGLSGQQEIDIIKRVARTEGVVLDPVYTGKAMLGLAEEIKKGRFAGNTRVVFVHTGGIFGLFPKKSLFF